MNHPDALAACEALVHDYGRLADAGDADAFCALYIAEGVFLRLGTRIAGRAAIREVIAARPAGVWTRHRCANLRIDVAPDGRSAQGTVDLEMQRGREGSTDVEHIRARYHDRFVLTDEGWKFAQREVVLA